MGNIFYDRSGRATAYTEDDVNIHLFSGHAVAFIDSGSVYDYSGRHLGWFEGGWVREHSGRCVLFTEEASGGPIRHPLYITPAKITKQVPPAMGPTKEPNAVPEMRDVWSATAGEQLFEWYSSL